MLFNNFIYTFLIFVLINYIDIVYELQLIDNLRNVLNNLNSMLIDLGESLEKRKIIVDEILMNLYHKSLSDIFNS
jgi:hypothetical protein